MILADTDRFFRGRRNWSPLPKADSYSEYMLAQARDLQDVLSLGAFAHIGLRNFDGFPKPSLEVWDELRNR